MYMRKSNLLILTTILISSLTACNISTPKDEGNFTVDSNSSFENLSDEYTIKNSTLNTYYLEGDKSVPYVDVREFVTALNGFLDSDNIKGSLYNFMSYMVLSYTYKSYTYKGVQSYRYNCIFDWNEDTIRVVDDGFFNVIKKSTSATSYNSHQALLSANADSQDSQVVYNLKDYGMQISYYQKHILVPFSVMNLLFCSTNMYNVYFNGSDYYGVMYYMNDTNPDEYKSIMEKGDYYQATPTAQAREFNYNFISFVMNDFYGLKDFYNVIDYRKYFEDNGYKDQFLSTDTSVFTKGYLNFFYKDLDELHTAITNYNLYDPNSGYKLSDNGSLASFYGDFRTKYKKQSVELATLAKEKYGEGGVPAIRYIGKETAVLHFDEFSVGTNEQIKSDTPWKYDTYEFMKHYLDEAVDKGVNNVIIDLSTNGGGSEAAMIRALGFLRDTGKDPVELSIHNYQTNQNIDYKYGVDINEKRYFNLNYSVMTSVCTYSAANYFTGSFINMGLGNVIGQQSGGGMCAILPVVLPDGTSVVMSGPSQLKIKISDSFYKDVQAGFKPDKTFDQNSYFYDDVYLANLVEGTSTTD